MLCEKDRLIEIDILKAIGILLMVYGHIRGQDVLYEYIHTFHMPLFFLISGFLYKHNKNCFAKFIFNKVRFLIVPYIAFGILHYFIKIPLLLYRHEDLHEPLKRLLWNNLDKLPICGALWFLTSLFFMYVFFYLLIDICNPYLRSTVLLVLMFLGFYSKDMTVLPYGISISLFCIGFMYLGYLFKINNNKIVLNVYSSTTFLLLGTCLSYINGSVNVRLQIYNNIILFYIIAILIVLGLYGYCGILKDKISKRLCRDITFVARYSIIYMAFNQLVIWLPNIIFTQYLNTYVFKILITIFCMVVLKFITIHISRSKYFRLILGLK